MNKKTDIFSLTFFLIIISGFIVLACNNVGLLSNNISDIIQLTLLGLSFLLIGIYFLIKGEFNFKKNNRYIKISKNNNFILFNIIVLVVISISIWSFYQVYKKL